MTPPKSPEPTAVRSAVALTKADGAVRSAVPPAFHFGVTSAVHVASQRWLSFVRIIRHMQIRAFSFQVVLLAIFLGLAKSGCKQDIVLTNLPSIERGHYQVDPYMVPMSAWYFIISTALFFTPNLIARLRDGYVEFRGYFEGLR